MNTTYQYTANNDAVEYLHVITLCNNKQSHIIHSLLHYAASQLLAILLSNMITKYADDPTWVMLHPSLHKM